MEGGKSMEKSMERIKELLSILNLKKSDWKDIVQKSEDIGEVPKELRHDFGKLAEMVCEFLKLEDNVSENELKTTINDNDLFEFIKKITRNNLFIFLSLKQLRLLQNERPEYVKNIFSFAFDSFILRYDPESCNSYKEFEFNDSDSFEKVLKTFDSLTQCCVGNLFTQKAAREFLMNNTSLNATICDFIAEKIDRNFLELKLNIIINKITL